ncbi:MAG TPA: NifU family protein [Longimicrobiales bacterium]|nr:NifU family protein [Longimicrobiales bacterium]
MLTFTDRAREMILQFAETSDDPKIRIAVLGSPFAPQYEFALVDEEPDAGDRVVPMDGFKVLVDEGSAARIQGATVEWVENERGTGFEVRNPNVRKLGESAPTGPLAERVRQVLETRVNPAVASHGGEITLVDVDGDVVYLELGGGCQGCGMARVTLKQGVEKMLREAIPEIRGIVDVTDHAAGASPYYAAS